MIVRIEARWPDKPFSVASREVTDALMAPLFSRGCTGFTVSPEASEGEVALLRSERDELRAYVAKLEAEVARLRADRS